MTPARPRNVALLLGLGLATLVACGDGVVGGACADGYEVCDGRCVPVGGCGVAPTDAGASDADVGVDSSTPADSADSGPLDSGTDGGGGDGAVDADGDADGGDALDSGDGAPDDVGTPEVDAGPTCDPGLAACPSGCADLDVDPLNCGACGNVCPTGLCNGGKCRGAKAGHVVAIGHDYEASSNAVVGKPLANATFLPSRNPVRLLVLGEYAATTALANVDSILAGAGKISGRTYVRTVVDKATDFHDKLNIDAFDVALVLDQKTAPTGTLGTTADTGKATYASFTKAGGVLVVLDGGGGTGEMPVFLANGGLLSVAAHVAAAGTSLDVTDPADAVGVDVLSPYLAPKGTVAFTWTTAPDLLTRVVVAVPLTEAPVVLHRVVKP